MKQERKYRFLTYSSYAFEFKGKFKDKNPRLRRGKQETHASTPRRDRSAWHTLTTPCAWQERGEQARTHAYGLAGKIKDMGLYTVGGKQYATSLDSIT